MAHTTPRRWARAALVVAALSGCVGPSTVSPDASDAPVGFDAANDNPLDALDGGDDVDEDASLADATPTDTGRRDVSRDAVPPGPLGPVTCRTDDDCPVGPCVRSAPGGICFPGCDVDDDCPTGTYCVPGHLCVRGCTTDHDCSVGQRCSRNECIARMCPCPAPYVCRTSDQFCVRPACADAGDVCPAPLTCLAGICVEP